MEISVNGQSRHFEKPLTVFELLCDMALQGKRLAVEKNGEIVPKSHHAAAQLAEGDRIEIVVAVGGG